MQGKEVVKTALSAARDVLGMFLGDLSDADLTVRPVPSANHIAWQMAHLIAAEKMLLEGQLPGVKYPEIPAGIAALGSERTGKVNPPGGYATKAQYMDAFNKMREASIAAVEKITDADLDRPTTNMMAKFAPTLGALLILVANHTLMHGGQFTVIRRALNKPVVF